MKQLLTILNSVSTVPFKIEPREYNYELSDILTIMQNVNWKALTFKVYDSILSSEDIDSAFKYMVLFSCLAMSCLSLIFSSIVLTMSCLISIGVG